jgi:hypothetical protein
MNVLKMINDDDEEEAYVAISNMLELERIAAVTRTENESESETNDPESSTVDSNSNSNSNSMMIPVLASSSSSMSIAQEPPTTGPSHKSKSHSYPKYGPSAAALYRMAHAKIRFQHVLERAKAHIRRMRGRVGFEKYHIPLLGPQEQHHLVHSCWMDFQKYVKQHAGWKLRRREACPEEKLVANQGKVITRKRFVIEAVYTPCAFQQQPMLPAVVANHAGSNSNSNVASTESLQSEQFTTAAAAAATTTATISGSLLMESTNVQPLRDVPAAATSTSTNAVSSKPPARTTMLPRTTSSVHPRRVPHPGAHMYPSPIVYPSPSVYPSQLPTTTARYSNSITTTPTDSFLQYGDLVTFPVLNITPPTTLLKAIVLQVHPLSNHDNHDHDVENDNNNSNNNTQLVTVSTGPGERFTVPLYQLVLIQARPPTPNWCLDSTTSSSF